MKKSFKTSLLLFITVILFVSCSTKINIHSLQPSNISSSLIKKITIKTFKNDSLHLRESIKDKMFSLSFNNKKYFTITDNAHNEDILEEQELQDSGLIILEETISPYTLQESTSILWGEILKNEIEHNVYYKEKINYNRCVQYITNKKGQKICSQYHEYEIRCVEKRYLLEAQLEIAAVKNAKTIYIGNFSANDRTLKCRDKPYGVSSDSKIFTKLKEKIAQDFIKIIAPSYSSKYYVLLEEEDISYKKEEKELLERAIKNIKNKNIKKSNTIFLLLVEKTKQQSSTALYNLALSYEALGKLESAHFYYKKAYNINTLEASNKHINQALGRIEKSMKNAKRLQEQLK